MRFIYLIIAVLMILFVGVQYNDPDGPYWMVLYGVPALLAGTAAFRPDLLITSTGKLVVFGALAIACVLTFVYWPQMPDWWQEDVWWQEETAREGMGMMIATFAVACLLPIVFSNAPRGFLKRG